MSQESGSEQGLPKIIVPDTNCVLNDPDALFKFAEHTVVASLQLFYELDRFKKEMNARGSAARAFARNLRKLMSERGYIIGEGVIVNDHGGRLIIDTDMSSLPGTPEAGNPDAVIINCANRWRASHPDREVILVTGDNIAADIAMAHGNKVEDHQATKTLKSVDDLYSGSIELEARDDSVLQTLGSRKSILAADAVDSLAGPLFPNQCCKIIGRDPGNYTLAIYDADNNRFTFVPKNLTANRWKVSPRNDQQLMAYALLTDPSISVVTLVGPAGTGKTMTALLASLNQLNIYQRILVLRPHKEIGGGMGFLPGTLGEKFLPWTAPVLQNLNRIMGNYDPDVFQKDDHESDRDFERNRKIKRGKGKGKPTEHANERGGRSSEHVGKKFSKADEYIRQGLIEISPIDYMRGQTLDGYIVIIDDAQNTSPKDMKTLLTRAGVGTKYMIVGDFEQVDDPYLSPENNGLIYVAEKLKGQRIVAHLTMDICERSALAELAARLL